MLVSLGRKPSSPDLVTLLLECHERIRNFTERAARLTTPLALDEAELVSEAARIERYFHEALPLHVADEEQTLLPRLLGLRPDLDAALRTLQEQHTSHEPLLADLRETLRGIQTYPTEKAHRQKLAGIAAALASHWELHLTLEETEIFPAVRTLLSPETHELMLVELRARRRTSFGPRP